MQGSYRRVSTSVFVLAFEHRLASWETIKTFSIPFNPDSPIDGSLYHLPNFLDDAVNFPVAPAFKNFPDSVGQSDTFITVVYWGSKIGMLVWLKKGFMEN